MSELIRERLYQLLPAIYRQRDAAQGQPLRALLALIEQDVQAIEGGIATLYENWFIETCDEWAVPHLGELLGVRGLGAETGQLWSQRSHIANVLGYRRRKGTAGVLEQVARDVSGWSTRAVEFFELLGVTQHLQAVRPDRGAMLDVRQSAALQRLGTPFEAAASRVDVRRIASGRGRHNAGNVGLFVWRLHSLPVVEGEARPVEAQPGCYTLHPLGVDQPLFNQPQPLPSDGRPAAANLPLPLTRQAVAADIAGYVGLGRSVEIVARNADKDTSVAPANVVSMDLSGWASPPEGKVALDVELGRLVFPSAPQQVLVSYSYGAAADIGGGPYDRRQTLVDDRRATWAVELGGEGGLTLAAALAQWNALDHSEPTRGVIRLRENSLYDSEQPLEVTIPQGAQLVIEAADGVAPAFHNADGVVLRGGGGGASLVLNGLLVSGTMAIVGELALAIRHCTLLDGLRAAEDAQGSVEIASSIVGPLRLSADSGDVTITDSIVDADLRQGGDKQGYALAAADAGEPGPRATLLRTTVLGRASVEELAEASDCIFAAPLRVGQLQIGMARYSYLAPGSQAPQRYRCQPDAAATAPQLRLLATRYGDPGYARLAPNCPGEIAAGAESGSEMGAYHNLFQLRREANLRAAVDEYLPFGLEAGLFYMT